MAPRASEADVGSATSLALVCWLGVGGLVLLAGVALLLGAVPLAPSRGLAALLAGPGAAGNDADALLLWQLRLPRVVLALAVGASLAVGGAVMQGLLRTPLADPGLLGVSAGGGLGAALWLALAGSATRPLPGELAGLAGALGLPLAAFTGAGLALAAVWGLATTRRRGAAGDDDLPGPRLADLLLAGLALNAAAGAGLALLVQLAPDGLLRSLTGWLYGSTARAGWPELGVGLPLLLAPVGLAWHDARRLDALLLGPVAAADLGVEVARVQRRQLLGVALAAGAAVALCGIIGFVGLLVPAGLRRTVGPLHGRLLPASMLGGAGLLLAADTVARTVVAPAELSVGVLTALAGALALVLLGRAPGAGGDGDG